jgi:hypothetical protein
MDQTLDLSGRQTYRLTRLYEAPEFVKSAAAEALGDPDLPADVYADGLHRHYPCHTAAATWLSTAFFLDKQGSYRAEDAASIDARLRHYAGYHGVERSIKDLRAKHAQQRLASTEAGPTPDECGLVIDGIGRYPLRNSAEVKTASDYLHAHRDSFSYDDRRKFAGRIRDKAAAHGCNLGELTDYIDRQAGDGACSAKAAAHLLRERVAASMRGPGRNTELQDGLLKLADSIEASPSQIHSPSGRIKLAAVVDAFDREVNLVPLYARGLARPEDVLFEFTGEKMASVTRDHVSTITGNVYRLADIEKVSTDQFRTYMGDDFVDEVKRRDGIDVEKVATIVPTLDRELANLFDRMMASAGCRPTVKEASYNVGFSQQYLQRLAEDYRASLPG